MRTITYQQLKKAGACSMQLVLFARKFGDSVEVTEELCAAECTNFDFEWAAYHLLSTTAAHIEHEKKRKFVRAEYEKVSIPLWKEYKEAVDPAWNKYAGSVWSVNIYTAVSHTDPAWEEYTKIRDLAMTKYTDSIAIAKAKFYKDLAIAFAQCYNLEETLV